MPTNQQKQPELKYPYKTTLTYAKERGLNNRASFHQVFVDLEGGGCLDIEEVADIIILDDHVEIEDIGGQVWTVPIGPEKAAYWERMIDALENGDDI